MKIFTLTLLMFGAFSLCAQTTDPNTDEYPKKLSVGQKRDAQSQAEDKTYTRTLADVERDISNIETKMKHVKEDPSEDAIAKEEGWYDQMEARLKYLRAEREKHLNAKK